MRKSDYDREFMKKNCKQIKLQLNKEKDKDIIQWLESQSNVNGTLKQLIREKIKGE